MPRGDALILLFAELSFGKRFVCAYCYLEVSMIATCFYL